MYRVRLLATVYKEHKALPGNIRHRVKDLLEALSQDARPFNSVDLKLEDLDLGWEIRRIRFDSWRVIYAIDEEFQQVAVLAIRKRPPYDYEDLPDLLATLD